MSDGRNDKTLSNERLPDPRSAAEELAEGSPRQRTADHLKRILATGMVLPIAAADCVVPRILCCRSTPSALHQASTRRARAQVDARGGH